MGKLRIDFAVFLGKVVIRLLRIMGRGATTLPGRVALRVCPDLLRELSKNREILTVTGTNGKTTTTHIITAILTNLGYTVITNVSGANLATGVATTLIEGRGIESRGKREDRRFVYVLETDEAAFSKIAGSLNPAVCVVTNLFRDQLDRYGELSHTRDFLAKGLDAASGAKILLNADDSLVASLAVGREDRSVFFGMDESSMTRNTVTNAQNQGLGSTTTDAAYCIFCRGKYEYNARSFGHLGDFSCPSCGYHRTKPAFAVKYSEDVTGDSEDVAKGEEWISEGSVVEQAIRVGVALPRRMSPSDTGYPVVLSYLGDEVSVALPIPGHHNFYNTLAAVAAVVLLKKKMEDEKSLFHRAAAAAESARPAFGRLEKIPVGNKEICLLLVKNPIGLERALTFVSQASDAGGMYLLLNSNDADGKDVSWIWDVDFESRSYPDRIFVSGERYGDMFLRLAYAGIEPSRMDARPMTECGELVDQALAACDEGKCLYILPNYTSMLALREILVRRYHLKDFWK